VATPAKRRVDLAADGGAFVSVEVTSAGGRRPVVVLCGSLPELGGRLARAGFAAVVFDPRAPRDLEIVLGALQRGALDLDADGRCGVLVTRTATERVAPLAAVGVPWLVVRDVPDEREVDAIVQWLARHLV
jgi:hypothetical protein